MNNTPLSITQEQILFEDNHIIVINKKPGQIVQGDKTGDLAMNESLKDFLKAKYNKPGNVFAGTVHRLDRPVSGVVIFAKTSKALSRLNESFRNRDTQKIYWAVVKNRPAQTEGTLIHYLKKNQEKNMSKAFDKEVSGSLKSELTYRLLSSSDNYHLLEVRPVTGRHHQIRVQLAAMGCPIKGDLKYGAKRSNPDGSIHLHARELRIEHPVKKELLSFVAPPPEENLWRSLKGS